MIVAIDGPAGSGKSTVASTLARRLGFRYLDTGAMYRALTWIARRDGVDVADGSLLAQIALAHPVSFGEGGLVEIDGEDVTTAIRDAEIDRLVPTVARHPQVREVMRDRQRALAVGGDSVIEGRDIGSVVAPQAEVKVFLLADADERARRRTSDRPGVAADDLAADLRKRDERDAINTTPADDAVLLDTTELTVDEVVERIAELVEAKAVNRTDAIWAVGRATIGTATKIVAPLRVYGSERVPLEGGLVVAANHLSWIDPPALGAAIPRTLYFMAKVEAHRVPGLGQLMRSFGAFSVRRGESDRDAVRTMREIVRNGHALGLFVEGTRQRSGVPGPVQPGAAMVAINEDAPVICAAIYGSYEWRLGSFKPVSVAWGTPLTFEGLPRGGKGYKEASVEIEREIRRLWEWLAGVHELGRPRDATPPS